MGNEVSHPFDPSCPYCNSTVDLRDRIIKRHEAEERRKKIGPSGKILGTDRQYLRPIDEGKEQAPKWANPAIQRPTLQKRLIPPSKPIQR